MTISLRCYTRGCDINVIAAVAFIREGGPGGVGERRNYNVPGRMTSLQTCHYGVK